MDSTTNITDKVIEIYSTPTCHFCHMAKEWLAAKNIPYTEYNVAVDAAKRTEMRDMTGQLGVPVIKVGDEIIVGFNPEHMAKLLGIPA
jgi:glutaredoxin 3